MVRFNRFIITSLLLLALSSLHSQEEEKVSFNFRVFGIGKDNYEGLYYFSGEKFEVLEFHRTHRSVKQYRYQGPPEFSIYVKNPNHNPNTSNSKEFTSVSTSSATISAETQLIVFAANPQNRKVHTTERRFKLFHVDDSLNSFKRNTIVLLNATGANLFGRVDGKDLNLPIGTSDPIPFKTASGKSTTRIAFALETKDGVRLVMSNDLHFSDNRRVLMILEPPRRKNSFRVAVRTLSESVFPPPVEE